LEVTILPFFQIFIYHKQKEHNQKTRTINSRKQRKGPPQLWNSRSKEKDQGKNTRLAFDGGNNWKKKCCSNVLFYKQ
jgi:hypothetical protein